MNKWVFCILLLLVTDSFAQNVDVSHVVHNISDYKDFKIDPTANAASVIVFLLPDCPASQNYTLTLNQFSEKYKSQRIVFYGMFPEFVKKEDIIAFQKEYQVKFPLLFDDHRALTNALHAHVAPGVFVLDQRSSVVYSGRIDDWMYAVGKKRTVITHHELQDALDAIVQGKKILIPKTQPVGCIID